MTSSIYRTVLDNLVPTSGFKLQIHVAFLHVHVAQHAVANKLDILWSCHLALARSCATVGIQEHLEQLKYPLLCSIITCPPPHDVPMVIKDAYHRERLHQIYFGNRPSLVVQDKNMLVRFVHSQPYLHQTDAFNT